MKRRGNLVTRLKKMSLFFEMLSKFWISAIIWLKGVFMGNVPISAKHILVGLAVLVSILPSVVIGGYFESIDINAETIPPISKELGFKELFSKLSKIKEIEKSEYETYIDYFRRREAWFESAQFNSELVAIRIDPSSRYDAESQELIISQAVSKGCGQFSRSLTGIEVFSEKTKFDPYVAQNNLGARVVISESTRTVYCVSVDSISFRVSLESSQAKQLKDNYSIVYVGKLVHPFTLSEDYFSEKPTMSNPYSIHEKAVMANLLIHQVWLVDNKTRKTVQRSADSLGTGRHQAAFRKNNKYCTPYADGYIDANGNSALHLLIWRGCASQAVEIVKSADRNVLNHRNKFGATPLHLAILKNDERSIYHLLAEGADPDVRDGNGESPREQVRKKNTQIQRFFE